MVHVLATVRCCRECPHGNNRWCMLANQPISAPEWDPTLIVTQELRFQSEYITPYFCPFSTLAFQESLQKFAGLLK